MVKLHSSIGDEKQVRMRVGCTVSVTQLDHLAHVETRKEGCWKERVSSFPVNLYIQLHDSTERKLKGIMNIGNPQ
jgi:hypothetical protein